MSSGLDFNHFRKGTDLLKRGFARMQKGGVIMDVVTPEQAAVAENAGAVSKTCPRYFEMLSDVCVF